MRSVIVSSIFAFLLIAMMVISCQDSEKIDQANYMSNGKDIYINKCQTCHGTNGEGLGKLAPPLTDTAFLKKYKPQLACFIKNGLHEPLLINGQLYDEKMPGFDTMTDFDIAQVLVFVTNSFGNKQGMYPYPLVSKDLERCK